MKTIILAGVLLFISGCANGPIVDFLGDKYYFSIKYLDESRDDIRTEGLEFPDSK